MSSAEVIDALFERTIDIVQSLPKTGPIQTSYEEKLALYSLYKQATEGDVNAKRPGMLDMLGRAKWDAWAKRKGYSSQEAKQLYVESLLKTLRKFSDRPQAIALIEELESFSGDVAQRVMSASLARAGSDTEGSSGSLSPHPIHRRTQGGYNGSDAEEDERDLVSQLPPRPTLSSRPPSLRAGPSLPPPRNLAGGGGGVRTPLSVDESSAMAVRGGGPASRAMHSDSDSDDEIPSRLAALPSHASQHRIQTGAPPSARGSIGQYGRGSSSTHQDARLYSSAQQRYPVPPRSESNAGGAIQTGGAGASLYSAIGPSRVPASEQHYYHHHGAEGGGRAYAASSIGGRSGGGGGGGGGSIRGPRAEVELALQSIQASLAAVHERLNQVESQPRTSSSISTVLFGSNSPFSIGYQAIANALHDIGLLLGLSNDGRNRGAAPSSFQMTSSKNRDGKRSESVQGGHGVSGKRNVKSDVPGQNGPGKAGLSALLRLLMALINLSIRLALDLTSVTVVISLVLFVFKRATGRGNPLLLFQLIQRYSGMRLSNKQIVEEPKTIKLG